MTDRAMADDRAAAGDRIRFLRMRAHGLLARDHTSAAAVARHLCGVQAQELASAMLAVRARATDIAVAGIEREMRTGAVARTWCMRGTLHLLADDDVEWIVELLGPVAIARSRRRRRQLSLDADVLDTGRRRLRRLLERGGALTRPDVAERLAREGVRLEGQALYHFLRHMALQGTIRVGPDREGSATYVLTDNRADRARHPSREAALTELARRYLAAHAPAGLDDFATWSGLGMRDARSAWRGLAEETMDVRLGAETVRTPKAHADRLEEEPPGDGAIVRMLPGYDPYLLGYRSREFAVAPEHAGRVHPGGGYLRSTVLVDGRVRGTWKSDLRTDGLEVRVHAFDRIAGDARSALEAEVEDVARFLGTGVAALRVDAPS